MEIGQLLHCVSVWTASQVPMFQQFLLTVFRGNLRSGHHGCRC